MKKIGYSLAAMALAGFASVVLAASAAVVDAVQLPAWLDRGGLTVPLSPGLPLQVGDTVRTGAGARLLLRLDEGSLVKLGENARFIIEKAQPQGGVYEATLGVINGAFRFTTQAFSKNKRRNVTIRLAQNATIGIRGTDLWGRGREDQDIVCLIEGKIEITGNDKKPQTLDMPLQFFQSSRTAPPEPLSFITSQQLETLAVETEIESGTGSSMKGDWRVVIDGFAKRESVREAARSLRSNGFPVEVAASNTLIIAKLDGERAASKLAAQLKVGFGFKEVRIGQ